MNNIFSFLYFRVNLFNNLLLSVFFLYYYYICIYVSDQNIFNSFLYNSILLSFTNSYLNIVLYIIVLYYILALILNKQLNIFVLYPINIYLTNNINNFYIKNTFSIQLINGFYYYHPILFCLFFVNVFFIILYIYYTLITKLNINKISLLYNKYFLFFWISLLIVTGGYWAQQELNWGGWWYWDPVELINYTYLLLGFIVTHFKKKVNLFNFFFLWVLFLVSYICLVRFDVINSIHSFVVTNIINQYKLYTIFYYIVLLMFILYYYNTQMRIILLNIYNLTLHLFIFMIFLGLILNGVLIFRFLFFIFYIYLIRYILKPSFVPIPFFSSLRLNTVFFLKKFTIFHIFIYILIFCVVYYSTTFYTFFNNIYSNNFIPFYYFNSLFFSAINNSYYQCDLNVYNSLSPCFSSFFIDNYLNLLNHVFLGFNRSFFLYNLISYSVFILFLVLKYIIYILVYLYIRKFYINVVSKIKLYY